MFTSNFRKKIERTSKILRESRGKKDARNQLSMEDASLALAYLDMLILMCSAFEVDYTEYVVEAKKILQLYPTLRGMLDESIEKMLDKVA
jgi:hypothetical protein